MWIKDDDRMIHHAKFRRGGELLGGAHAFARVLTCFKAGQCYANHHETGGFLADAVVAGFAQFVDEPATVAAALVECRLREGGAGLWERVPGGYQIHDYEQYQPTSEQLAGAHKARAEAGRRGGLASGRVRRVKQNEAPASPEPKQTGSKPPSKIEANHEANHEANDQAKTNPDPDPGTASENEAVPRAQARETHPRRASLISGPDPRVRRYGRVKVWQAQHQDFRARLAMTDVAQADVVLDEFYEATEQAWTTAGDVPEGSDWAVWQRAFDRRFGTTSSRASSAAPATAPFGHDGSRWEVLCDALEARGHINRHDRLVWLRRHCDQLRATAGELVVRVSPDAQAWVAKHYQPALEQVLGETVPGCRLELVVDQEAIA